METITLKENALLLEKHIEKVKGQFTLNDAAVITGVPVEQARESLNELMSKYICHLQVSENGDLIYDFGVKPIIKKAIIEDESKKVIWKPFENFFKIWIAITALIYLVVLSIILGVLGVITFFIGATSAKPLHERTYSMPKNGDVGSFMGWDYMLRNAKSIFQMIFSLKSISQDILKPNSQSSQSFIQYIYNFIFGASNTSLLQYYQNNILKFAQKNQGITILADIKALTGLQTKQAEKLMISCITHVNGLVKVGSNGLIYIFFSNLDNFNPKESFKWYWNKPRQATFSGNPMYIDIIIIFSNILNLILSAIFILNETDFILESESFIEALTKVGISFYLWGIIPFLFSFIFFLVVIYRFLRIVLNRNEQKNDKILKKLTKIIYEEASKKDLTIDEIQKLVNEKSFSQTEIKDKMNILLQDWNGKELIQPNGKILYQFKQLQLELSEVQKIR